jgi:hypothetical protein
VQQSAGYVIWLASLAILVWLVFGLPIWIALGCMSVYGDRRSRMQAAAGDGTGGEGPVVSGFARVAKALALSVVGVIGLWVALSEGPWDWFSGQPVMGALFVVLAVLTAALPVLLILLAICFVALLGDMRAKHRVAGRDTVVAYGVILTLHSATLLAAFASGFFGHSMMLM